MLIFSYLLPQRKTHKKTISKLYNLTYFTMSQPITLILALAALCTSTLNAQDYTATLIPDSLLENANSVIRDYSEIIELNSMNNNTKRIHIAITIINRNGDNDATLFVPFDKDSKVTILKSKLYDKNGKLVKKIKNSEIGNFPLSDGASMYSDNRQLYYRPTYAEYPYTVEYEYEYQCDNAIGYGNFTPYLEGYYSSVEHACLTVLSPEGLSYNKKEVNGANISKRGKDESHFIEKWEFNNLKAIEYEPFSVSFREIVPIVFLMPTQLIYNEHIGYANNWNEYGKWVYQLYEGRNVIAENEKPKIDAILKNGKNTIDSIRILYEYMQSRTRYIGIQLGIGGFQPFSAQTVFETGYGDCKALSNYMHALLTYARIKSHPTLVSAGKYPIANYADFPNFNTFNHVILCVPNNNDTIWLECTSQSIPFGFLSDFTDNRDVLLLTPNGGQWAHTKQYQMRDNVQSTHTEFEVLENGSVSGSILTRYKGLEYDVVSEFIQSNADEQRKWILKHTSLPSMQLANYSIVNNKNMIPEAILTINAMANDYCSFSGNYMILPLNKLNKQEAIQKMIKTRNSDFILLRPSINYDTAVYHIPENYTVVALPEKTSIESDFGNYSYSVKQEGNNLIYSRIYELKQGRFKACEYKKFYDFVYAVAKTDNAKVMLAKK
jgi:hypothetical protein